MTAERERSRTAEPQEQSSRVQLWLIVLAVLVLGGVVEVIIYGYLEKPGWIGSSSKQFWDYLDLLIVPAALALGVYWLNRRQDERDQQAEEDRSRRETEAQAAQVERALEVENERAQDAAVQAYLDQLTQLLVTQSHDALIRMQVDDDVRQVIQARSEPLLRSLSATRRWSVILFLAVMGLLGKDRPLVSLVGADLRGVDGRGAPLEGIDLGGANLMEANLSRANLSRADLIRANLVMANLMKANLRYAGLIEANLSRANLSNADLSGVVLSEANLIGAGLFGAYLMRANLRNADLSGAYLMRANLREAVGLTDEQLVAAHSLEGAAMPNGQKYEDWLKSKDQEGNKKSDGSS